MRATGIRRKIDDLGRIVLPKELRKSMGIMSGTPLEIYTEDNKIILKKYNSTKCLFCDNTVDLVECLGKNICRQCLNEINDIS